MTAITVGSEVINRFSQGLADYTFINKTNPADGTGVIDTIQLWMAVAGTVSVGLFYVVSGDNLSTRSGADLGSLATGYHEITGLSLAVEAGDYIGFHNSGGRISRTNSGSGGGGQYYQSGDHIPCTNVLFLASDGFESSIKGLGATVSAGSTAGAQYRGVSLVEYASPDLIPAALQPVAFITGTVPDRARKVAPNWVASPDLIPADQIGLGAVKYATADLVPARLKKVGSG